MLKQPPPLVVRRPEESFDPGAPDATRKVPPPNPVIKRLIGEQLLKRLQGLPGQ
jgi:hypothetical protein